MAAVLLRRVFLQLEYKDLVEELPAQVISNCQAEMLVAVQMETNAAIRRKICDAVAELARSSLGKGNGLSSDFSKVCKRVGVLDGIAVGALLRGVGVVTLWVWFYCHWQTAHHASKK